MPHVRLGHGLYTSDLRSPRGRQLIRSLLEDKVVLDEASARAFLTALTDVRLVLGERMGLRTDEDLEALEAAAGELDPDDPLGYALAVYDFLTWLQETLASAMLTA